MNVRTVSLVAFEPWTGKLPSSHLRKQHGCGTRQKPDSTELSLFDLFSNIPKTSALSICFYLIQSPLCQKICSRALIRNNHWELFNMTFVWRGHWGRLSSLLLLNRPRSLAAPADADLLFSMTLVKQQTAQLFGKSVFQKHHSCFTYWPEFEFWQFWEGKKRRGGTF